MVFVLLIVIIYFGFSNLVVVIYLFIYFSLISFSYSFTLIWISWINVCMVDLFVIVCHFFIVNCSMFRNAIGRVCELDASSFTVSSLLVIKMYTILTQNRMQIDQTKLCHFGLFVFFFMLQITNSCLLCVSFHWKNKQLCLSIGD